jgi:hypothetical protein
MKYRIHLFVQVRVEYELNTDTPEDAARLAFDSDLDRIWTFIAASRVRARSTPSISTRSAWWSP